MWISLFAIFSLLFCGIRDAESSSWSEERIVGGYPINITDAPYMASLGVGCGASIISSEWLLTAAHCYEKERISTYANSALKACLGSSKSMENGQILEIKNVLMHPKYSGETMDFDFALLQLNGQINFNENKKPIKLAEANHIVKDGEMCAVCGWGFTLNEDEPYDWLRRVDIPILNRKKCQKSYSLQITKNMICAGSPEGGKNSYVGDSGGPLVTKDGIQVGVVSFGKFEAQGPGVYSRVSSVREWIREETGV